MLLKDSFIIEAPVAAVWTLLQDVQHIAACVPGVEKVKEMGQDAYTGLLRIRVGPISASFVGQVTITERVPPEKLVAEVGGQDKGSASSVKAIFTGRLSAVERGTRLDYEMDIALRGRLAQFGLAVVQGTAKKITVEFARCFTAALATAEAEQPDQSTGAAA